MLPNGPPCPSLPTPVTLAAAPPAKPPQVDRAQLAQVEAVPAAGRVLVRLDAEVDRELLAGLVEALVQELPAELACSPALEVSCLAARSPASFSVFFIAFLPSWATSRLKICWMAMRVAAMMPPAAGDAAPSVSTTATASASSSATKMPSSIQASIFAPSISQPVSSHSLPISWVIDSSATSGASSPWDDLGPRVPEGLGGEPDAAVPGEHLAGRVERPRRAGRPAPGPRRTSRRRRPRSLSRCPPASRSRPPTPGRRSTNPADPTGRSRAGAGSGSAGSTRKTPVSSHALPGARGRGHRPRRPPVCCC